MVIQDGLFRASWHWKDGWLESDRPVDEEYLMGYAKAFVSKFDPWFQAANERRLCATVYEAKSLEPLRIIRFAIERQAPPSELRIAASDAPMAQVLAEAYERMTGMDAAPSLNDRFRQSGEVRLTSRTEIVIAKPSARRHWLAVNALADARAVLEESFRAT